LDGRNNARVFEVVMKSEMPGFFTQQRKGDPCKMASTELFEEETLLCPERVSVIDKSHRQEVGVDEDERFGRDSSKPRRAKKAMVWVGFVFSSRRSGAQATAHTTTLLRHSKSNTIFSQDDKQNVACLQSDCL